MSLFCGIDLHSNNSYLGILSDDGKRVYKNKLSNDIHQIVTALEPYRRELESVAVESTFNWYWLVDGLMSFGYDVKLANPTAIKQYDGLKYSDDFADAFHLAQLLTLKILPVGHIYPKDERPVRDLLRKRMLLVRQRTTHILSFENLVSRNLGTRISSNEVKKMTEEDVEKLLGGEHLVLSGKVSIAMIKYLTEHIKKIEKSINTKAKEREEYKYLLTVPGIGQILAETILLETDSISRFPSVGKYVSYCRCVNTTRISNGKNKGKGNSKNGNQYLSWAYIEAANLTIRNYVPIRKYYQKKAAKTNRIVALKTVAHKLARACLYDE